MPDVPWRTVVLAVAVVFSAGGCRPSDPAALGPPVRWTGDDSISADMAPAAAGETAEVTVDVKSWSDVEQMVAEHAGKVVVVDVWSTWCFPCLEEFPHLVQLHRAHTGALACISVNIDYIGLEEEPPEASREKVLEFLRTQEAAFQNVICSDPEEAVLSTLQIASIPAVLVYDRQGQLRKRFVNDDQQYGDDGFEYQLHIVPLVEQLLQE